MENTDYGLIESQDMMGFINGEFVVPTPYVFVLVAEGATETKEIENPQHLAWGQGPLPRTAVKNTQANHGTKCTSNTSRETNRPRTTTKRAMWISSARGISPPHTELLDALALISTPLCKSRRHKFKGKNGSKIRLGITSQSAKQFRAF